MGTHVVIMPNLAGADKRAEKLLGDRASRRALGFAPSQKVSALRVTIPVAAERLTFAV